MKQSPLQQVKERFENKEKLVGNVMDVLRRTNHRIVLSVKYETKPETKEEEIIQDIRALAAQIREESVK